MIIVLNPYSGNKIENYIKAFKYVMKLLKQGKEVFSPIIYGHFISEFGGLKGDYKTWEFLNDLFPVATEFHILLLDGWEKSIGLKKELEKIKKMDKPIKYFDEDFKEVRNEISNNRM